METERKLSLDKQLEHTEIYNVVIDRVGILKKKKKKISVLHARNAHHTLCRVRSNQFEQLTRLSKRINAQQENCDK